MESGGGGRSSAGGGDSSRAAGTSGSGTNISSRGSSSRNSGGSSSGASSRSSSVSGGGIIVSTSGAGGGGAAPPPTSEWEMFQFGKYSMDILEMLSGHQAHQFKGLGLERQLQHQQHAQLQHQQQLQQQPPPGETSGPLLSGLGLGALQGSRSNAFADSSSIFAKMSVPSTLPQQTQSSSQSSRKSSKISASSGSAGGSGGSATGYPQFLRPFHPAEAALAQEQLHPGLGRFEHFSSGSSSGVVTSPPPPPPLHPGLTVPQASPGQPSSSPSPSTSASTSNNPSSSNTVASLGQQLAGAQSEARSLHQQFSCMLAANQYFLSGVPPNASLEQFLVQQGTHNHLSLGQGGDSNSGLAPPPLHSSHSHGHLTPQQQQQQLPPHALSHPHPHHPLHSAPQPPPLGSFDFQGIPVLSSNQIASLMQQETGLPLPLPLHLSLPKDEGKDSGGSGGGRRKKAMLGYLPQRKSDNISSSSNCHSSGDANPTSNSGGHSLEGTSSLVGGSGRVGIASLGGDPSPLLSSAQTASSSTVSSSSSTAPSCTSASVLVTNCSQLSKTESQGSLAPTPTQPEPEPLYHCGECGKTFTHLSSLRRHLRSHGLSTGGGSTNPNPNHNPSLPHSTQDLASQSNHHHSQPQQDPSLGTQQQQSNPAPTSSSSCPSPEKTHCCPECGKGFKKRGHLLQHGVIHSGARPFACPICQRSFNRRESLTRHEKIHEDKPYRCPACGRCFRESTSLLNHAASGTCGKPGRRSRSRKNNSHSSGPDGQKIHKVGAEGGTGIVAGGSGVGEYQGAQLGAGVAYGKAEGGGVVSCVMGVNEEEEDDKASLSCQGLFQQGRGVNANGGSKTEGKYGHDFSRNYHQTPYRGDDYRAEYKQHRSQSNSCYPSDPPCGNGMASPALRKAPLAPTLHPHPQSQTQQQQQPHLPLSSLLDDSEDDVTSSVGSAMSAIAAAAAASCMPGELNNGGSRGEERRDIIGGLLGGLGFGSVGTSSGGPSSTSGMNKTYRGQGGNGESMGGTVTTQTNQNQQQNNQQAPKVKPKRPRKPRPKKEPGTAGGASGEVKRRRHTQSGAGTSGEGRERPFLCSVCGRGFSRRETLRRHDRVHTGEKPYHCDVCGKDFREAFHLTKHRTVHSGEKNYKCELCGKEFGYAQSLKRHGKLHLKGEFGDAGTTAGVGSSSGAIPGVSANQDGEQGTSDSYYYSQDKTPGSNTQPPPRLYTCAICWKSFRHHFHLTAHQQAVHEGGDKLFCCEVCGKAFAYANSLTRHRLSQHGLSRTGQTHQPGGDRAGRVGEGPGVTGSLTESGQATNSLLQLGPPGVAQGGQRSDVSPTQHPPHPQPQSGYSPLFYHPEPGSTHSSASSAPPHSHPLQTHSTQSAQSHHQQPAGIKGAPVYPTGPSNVLNLASTAIYQPLSQQYPHSQQRPAEILSPHLEQQGNIRKYKKKKTRKNYQGYQNTQSVKQFSASEQKNEQNRLQKRKIRIRRQLFNKKRRLAELLRDRGGRTRHGGLRVGHLSSLDVIQKQFVCPLCPCSAFPRKAAFLVHHAARHHQTYSCRQARMECILCRKRFRKFLAALRHRGFHLARGSFSCTRCPSRFWNGSLLERHKAVCQGVQGHGSDWGVKSKTATKRTRK
ncbi:uncharacterized protein LOC133137768 [Conger conger]|uniref:uncharacterized protein LOC133137768 n=1 Tax=Conger conger TaxID=82655 RepID=UPI002A5AC707|nr:uncharacterized protein LOC133137768 [Conger conger]XP_061112087.1 uncharacterized protein LOC133137768 [Conger conger]